MIQRTTADVIVKDDDGNEIAYLRAIATNWWFAWVLPAYQDADIHPGGSHGSFETMDDATNFLVRTYGFKKRGYPKEKCRGRRRKVRRKKARAK